MKGWLLGGVLLVILSSAISAIGRADDDTCVACHEVDIDAVLALPVPEWRESVHAASGVSCDACHGGDPRVEDADASMSPEAGFMDLPSWTEMTEHCGACHEGIAESYRQGRFGAALADGIRVATCASCHMQEGHRVQEAQPGQIVTSDSCPGCPALADPQAAVALLGSAREARGRVLERLAAVEDRGIELSDYRARLQVERARLARAVHGFDDGEIARAHAASQAKVDEIAQQVSAYEGQVDRRVRFGAALLAALAAVCVCLWLMLRSLS